MLLPTICEHVPNPSEREIAVFLTCCQENPPATTAKGRIRGAIEQGLERGAEQQPGVISTIEKVLQLPILQALEVWGSIMMHVQYSLEVSIALMSIIRSI